MYSPGMTVSTPTWSPNSVNPFRVPSLLSRTIILPPSAVIPPGISIPLSHEKDTLPSRELIL